MVSGIGRRLCRFGRVDGSEKDKEGVLRDVGSSRVDIQDSNYTQSYRYVNSGQGFYRIYLLEEEKEKEVPYIEYFDKNNPEKNYRGLVIKGKLKKLPPAPSTEHMISDDVPLISRRLYDKAGEKGDVTTGLMLTSDDMARLNKGETLDVTARINNEFRKEIEKFNSLFIKSKPTVFNILKNKTMGILSKFRELVRTEPDKSLVKYGLMDANGNPTAEGQELAITHYFLENKSELKAKYLDPIIEEEEKSKKK